MKNTLTIRGGAIHRIRPSLFLGVFLSDFFATLSRRAQTFARVRVYVRPSAASQPEPQNAKFGRF